MNCSDCGAEEGSQNYANCLRLNYARDERSPPTARPTHLSEIPFNGTSIYALPGQADIIKQQIHELLSRRPESYHIELEEKLLATETSLLEAENKVELLSRTNDMQTDRIERLENVVRVLAPYEQFFRVITTLLRLPTPAPTPTPNGDTNG